MANAAKKVVQSRLKRNRKPETSALVQEEYGVHISISTDLERTAQHCAAVMAGQYCDWRERDRYAAWGQFKRNHFSVAVGGGNTVKAVYRAWLEHYATEIDWIGHVRFFFLEESSGETGWESARSSLIVNFIVPLAHKLIRKPGRYALVRSLGLELPVEQEEIIDAMIATMLHPIDMLEVKKARERKDDALAMKLAMAESVRYQREIRERLGGSMAFNHIVSGIGKDATLGAFAPYTPELEITDPGVQVLKQPSGALRIALNRGVLTNAERISLIVSGTRKLKALGRFELEEATDFEQTVMETPLRMLRATPEIAEKVYIFADEQSLHFDETVFEFRDRGHKIINRAETRIGDEPDGIHGLLLHGFMGLFSFTGLLIRLPSAWTVSAMRRGSHAKMLENDEIFPSYALSLRKAILKIWRQGRPAPVVGHSMAGAIFDHLLLSLLDHYEADIPPYENLKPENRQLVDALRAGGMVYLATWAPPDSLHSGENIKGLVSHRIGRGPAPTSFSTFDRLYNKGQDGKLHLVDEIDLAAAAEQMTGLDRFLRRPISRHLINAINTGMRKLLGNKKMQHKLLNAERSYVWRLLNGRMLRRISYYGLIKEMNAAMHHPVEYQRRHLKALEVLLAYDIPYLGIIHVDDSLVSYNRHKEEYDWMLARRLEKEGVKRAQDLEASLRLVTLKPHSDEAELDPLNPHLMIMSTTTEGNILVREVTAAMTDFVYDNVYKAVRKGKVKPLDSVARWVSRQAGDTAQKSGRKGKVANNAV